MDLSWVILICGAATLVLALIFLFFGYKLARFLLPLCGVLIGLGLLSAFVLDSLRLNGMETWLFMGGAGVSLYILLFFFKRIAGFFAGVLGSALMLVYIVYAFGLDSLPYLYPACLTLCAVSGVLAVFYHRKGVITFTSLLGACVAVFTGLFLYFKGVNPEPFSGGVLTVFEEFLAEHSLMIAGISLVATVAGIVVQSLITSQHQVLSGSLRDEEPSERLPRRPRSERAKVVHRDITNDPPAISE